MSPRILIFCALLAALPGPSPTRADNAHPAVASVAAYEYAFRLEEGLWHAPNRAQDFRTVVDGHQVRITARRDAAWTWIVDRSQLRPDKHREMHGFRPQG